FSKAAIVWRARASRSGRSLFRSAAEMASCDFGEAAIPGGAPTAAKRARQVDSGTAATTSGGRVARMRSGAGGAGRQRGERQGGGGGPADRDRGRRDHRDDPRGGRRDRRVDRRGLRGGRRGPRGDRDDLRDRWVWSAGMQA